MHKNNCRVCGFELSSPPWGDDGESPSWEICPCCGTEFGYEDCTQVSSRVRRNRWISFGMKWFNEREKPANWSFEWQEKNIPAEYK
jgi:hypothetical protein